MDTTSKPEQPWCPHVYERPPKQRPPGLCHRYHFQALPNAALGHRLAGQLGQNNHPFRELSVFF